MTEITIANAPAAVSEPIWKDVELEEGFPRGDTQIMSVKLRRPKSGELRGLTLEDIIHSNVDAVIKLLPRISDPVMTTQDAEALCPADLVELAGAVAGFFMNSAVREAMKKMASTA